MTDLRVDDADADTAVDDRPTVAPTSAPMTGASRSAWVMLAPNLVLTVVFIVIPLGWAFMLSLQAKRSFGPGEWLGLENFAQLLGDDVFWRALLNTGVFTLATVPASIALGLGLAIALDKAMPARGLFRTIVYLPVAVSTVVVSLVGLLLFDESVGMINGLLADLGIAPVSWQSDGTLAMVSVVVMTLWTRIGFAVLIYLAALQDLDDQVLEAASLDGANAWQRFRHVIVPSLRPTTLFLVVVLMTWSFQVFDVVFIMTNGGPGYSTTMLVTYAYDEGFGAARNFGYGSTVGVVIFVITAVLTVGYAAVVRRRNR